MMLGVHLQLWYMKSMYLSKRKWLWMQVQMCYGPMGRSHGHGGGVGSFAQPDEASLWSSANSGLSPREAPTSPCTFVAGASSKHLAIIIIVFFECVMDVNSIWLVGCLVFPTFQPSKQKDPPGCWPPQSDSKAVSIKAQPVGCFCSWRKLEQMLWRSKGSLGLWPQR